MPGADEVLQGKGLDEVSSPLLRCNAGRRVIGAPFSCSERRIEADAMTNTSGDRPDEGRLEELVAEADTGGRKPTGIAAKAHLRRRDLPGRCSSSGTPRRCPSCSTSASSTTARRARSICASPSSWRSRPIPAFASSPRDRIPLDRLGAGGRGHRLRCSISSCSTRDLALRPGLPTTADIVVSVIGVVLLLEASRRAVGPAMPVIAAVMLLYMFLGP